MPRCDCGRPLKPDVVLFGEYLPVDALERAEQLARRRRRDAVHRLLARGLPGRRAAAELTLAAGGRLAIITQGPTPFDARAAVRMGGDVVDELGAVLDALALND